MPRRPLDHAEPALTGTDPGLSGRARLRGRGIARPERGSFAGPEDAAPIRLAYPRIVARVPHECGEWPSSALSDFGNKDYWKPEDVKIDNLADLT